MIKMNLSAEEVRMFVFGKTLHAFDPDTLMRVATIYYRRDGTCQLTMENGDTDAGQYGFEEDQYWTRYNRFRDGVLHRFSLIRIDTHSAQAMYEDGSRAFIQSPLIQLMIPKG